MESGTDNKRRSRFATFLLLALLTGMSVLALVPAMFGGAAIPVAARSTDPDALAALDNKFRTIKNGKGVAYTIPLSSVIGTLIFGFLSDNRMAVKENK